MLEILRKNLYELSCALPTPLYAVGGCVRDFLAGLSPHSKIADFDICAPLPAEKFVSFAQAHGFQVKSVYKNTETVKLQDAFGVDYEYAAFRSDKYVRGVHAPIETVFTTDIVADATRRDFTANAVYYDIKKGEFVDPLGGMQAILEKRLSTVAPAKKVFSEDGLRLMRLARQSAQLGFLPDEECMLGAKENAALIQDISPERIFSELCAILTADKRFGITGGHYQGLIILNETRVLDYIMPELTLGRNMAQRPDFHRYDVLTHSLKAVFYAEDEVRLAALLHDVGKPFCMLRDGNSYSHPQEGARISEEILRRLKAPKRTIEQVSKLVGFHQYDFNCCTKENKLRRFFVKNYPYLSDILKVKQADFSACKDDTSLAPTCKKWKELLKTMQAENVPFTLKNLAVNGKDLLSLDIPAPKIASILHLLLEHTALYPKDNTKAKLCALALKMNEAGMR